MKILIFSDSHLTENFEEKKFNFLKKIIQQSDSVIINGDFWDGYRTTFDRFISSDWNKLFPLLKSKKTVYIHGNHDRETYIDQNASLFSDLQTHTYRLQLNGKVFIIEHGHRFYPLFDEILPRILNKVSTIIVGFFLRNISLLRFILKR
ncbi:metallophosphoesterase family protein, partial [Candidatus Roizmanbacteria bacterium]|nr:metallophosphoesterase family protein [Candidatus Roizmanbacteria bacterium]